MHLVIIGGGPAGYTAAFDGARRGMRVTLVEKSWPGGTCLNHGCIPAKTMRASADALNMAKRMLEFGVTGCGQATIDPAAVKKRKDNVINVLRQGLTKTFASLGIRLIQGGAFVRNRNQIDVLTDSGIEQINGDALLIATGSVEFSPPSLPVDHKYILNSSDALELDYVPRRLVIVGGGVTGCELACFFRTFGSEVTIVESQERLLPLPHVDRDVSALLAREMRKQKIKIFTGFTLDDLNIENGMVLGNIKASPCVKHAESRPEQPIETDVVFVTVGRAPASGGLGLRECGVGLDKQGWIVVDANLRTSVPGIYAAGDILGPAHMMLAHVAAVEGLSVVAALKGEYRPMDYRTVPSAIFTSPEIGCVGLTEAQAGEVCDHVVCGVTQMRELGKAQAMGELSGFFKLIINGNDGKILGAQIMGAHASDILAEATLTLSGGATVHELVHTIHAHPTLAEGMWEAARNAAANIREKIKK